MKIDKINNWVPETKDLIKSLEAAGCEIVGGSNGESSFKRSKFQSLTAFLEELLACDEGALYVKTPSCKGDSSRWVYLVLGNDPGELVCDHTVDLVLNRVVAAHYTKWEARSQPMLFRAVVYFADSDNHARFTILTAATEDEVRAKAVVYALKNNLTIV